MNWRCVGFFLRGMIFLRPIPYHSDFRCYMRGQAVTGAVILCCIPASIFAAGFVLGRLT